MLKISAQQLTFLGTRPFVDRAKIGVIGVCGSGSFVISAAKIDPRMKAIATVSMYDMGSASRNALNHSQTLEQRKRNYSRSSRAKVCQNLQEAKRSTLAERYISLDENTHPIQREFFDFYRTPRGEYTPKGGSPEDHYASYIK
jgi:fermentation-respiration switch protein FrsA (DUF1100 family)